MIDHLIGCVWDHDGDCIKVGVFNGSVTISYGEADLAWYDAARARALAAMLHAAVDHVERLQSGVTQRETG